MIFRYSLFENELVKENPLSFVVIESALNYVTFFAHLERSMNGDSDHFSILSKGNVQRLDRSLEWIKNNWCLENVDRKMLNSLYSQLDKDYIDTEQGQDLIASWYHFQDQIVNLLSTHGYAVISESVVSLSDIFSVHKVQFRELPSEDYLNRLLEFLSRMLEHTAKRLFLFENLMSYLSSPEINELLLFCQSEELYIVDIESSLSQKLKENVGRLIVLDQDLCELVMREP